MSSDRIMTWCWLLRGAKQRAFINLGSRPLYSIILLSKYLLLAEFKVCTISN